MSLEDCVAAVTAIEKEMDITKERYADALRALRDVCTHEILLEASWQQQTWFDDLLPLRICETCGVEEEGWSFRVLTGRAYKVARNEIYKARKREPGRALVKK